MAKSFFDVRVSGTSLARIAKIGVYFKDYPRLVSNVEKGSTKILYKYHKQFQDLYKQKLVKNLRKIGPGFATGNSQVERFLTVEKGGAEEAPHRGLAGLQAVVTDKQASKIARAWNRGALILPTKSKFLAEPFSKNRTLSVTSPWLYDTGEFTSFVYKNESTLNKVKSRNRNIKQGVEGLWVIRRKGLVKETVARYVLLKWQYITPTYWADKATSEFVVQAAKDVAAITAAEAAGIIVEGFGK